MFVANLLLDDELAVVGSSEAILLMKLIFVIPVDEMDGQSFMINLSERQRRRRRQVEWTNEHNMKTYLHLNKKIVAVRVVDFWSVHVRWLAKELLRLRANEPGEESQGNHWFVCHELIQRWNRSSDDRSVSEI